jgi:hypothetical protein
VLLSFAKYKYAKLMLESFKSGEKIININETWIPLNELRCKNSKLGANEKATS